MIPLEHIATGLPTIYTDYSGPLDYARIPMREPLGHPLRWTPNVAYLEQKARWSGNLPNAFIHQGDEGELTDMVREGETFGLDAWPDFAHLMELMALLYQDRGPAREKALDDAAYVHTHWTWERAVQQVIEAIEDMGWEPSWAVDTAKERRSSLAFPRRDVLDVGEMR